MSGHVHSISGNSKILFIIWNNLIIDSALICIYYEYDKPLALPKIKGSQLVTFTRILTANKE